MTESKPASWSKILPWSGVASALMALSIFWPAMAELLYWDGAAIRFVSLFGDFYTLKPIFIFLGILIDFLLSLGMLSFVLFAQAKAEKPHAEAGIVSMFFGGWVLFWMTFNNFLLFAFTKPNVNVAGIFAAIPPIIALLGGVILGIIFGIIALFQKNRLKWLGIAGLVLNLLSAPVSVLLVLFIPEGFLG